LEMEFLFFLLRGAAGLEGDWERLGDHFAGCVVRVGALGDSLVARIVRLPPAMAQAGWNEGDVKWRDIEPRGTAAWRMRDVRKHFDTRSRSVVGIDTRELHLTVAGDKLRLHGDLLPIFPDQRWRRIGKPVGA
jgi:hypothetical protein